MENTWSEQTLEIVNDLKKEKDELQKKMESLKQEIAELENVINSSHSLIVRYHDKHKIAPVTLQGIKPGQFGQKSYSAILNEIAEKNGGRIVTKDTVKAIMQAGVSNDKNLVQANVFAALRRMRNRGEVDKIRDGEYMLVKTNPKPSLSFVSLKPSTFTEDDLFQPKQPIDSAARQVEGDLDLKENVI